MPDWVSKLSPWILALLAGTGWTLSVQSCSRVHQLEAQLQGAQAQASTDRLAAVESGIRADLAEKAHHSVPQNVAALNAAPKILRDTPESQAVALKAGEAAPHEGGLLDSATLAEAAECLARRQELIESAGKVSDQLGEAIVSLQESERRASSWKRKFWLGFPVAIGFGILTDMALDKDR